MVDASRVNVLEASQKLVQEKLNVVVCEGLVRLDNLRKIRLHEFGDHVDFIEGLSVLGLENSLDAQHVLVL